MRERVCVEERNAYGARDFACSPQLSVDTARADTVPDQGQDGPIVGGPVSGSSDSNGQVFSALACQARRGIQAESGLPHSLKLGRMIAPHRDAQSEAGPVHILMQQVTQGDFTRRRQGMQWATLERGKRGAGSERKLDA